MNLADKIVMRPVASLVPYASNARTHTADQISLIARSISSALGEVTNDDRCDWRDAWALFPGDVAYIWYGGVHAGTVQASQDACRFTVRSQIIWAKSQLVISRGRSSRRFGDVAPIAPVVARSRPTSSACSTAPSRT